MKSHDFSVDCELVTGEDEFKMMLTRAMSDRNGQFVGRIGGSDFDAVAHFLGYRLVKPTLEYPWLPYNPLAIWHINKTRNLNGLFSKNDRELPEVFRGYLQVLHDAYEATEVTLYGNQVVANAIELGHHTSLGPYLQKICHGKTLIPYKFLEGVRPFMSSFRDWGEGRRILVVSPFSESVQFQWPRRQSLLNGERFPDGQILTLTTPVTYNNKIDVKKNLLQAKTGNWLTELERLKDEINELKFDVALLSCGSYAMPLGVHIANNLGKNAVYLGGALNPIFNIAGARFETPFYEQIMRAQMKISPVEMQDLASVDGGRGIPGEALAAYLPKH